MSPATRSPSRADAQVERFLGHVFEPDGEEARHLVDGLLAAGWSPQRIVTDLLAPVQREVGRLWQVGRLSAAEEHVSTAVVDDLLGALIHTAPPARSSITVAVACAEGDWHVTPARMANLLLRLAGWRTVFVGGSTPTGELRRGLDAWQPDVLAVSCTDPRALFGAARMAAAARSLHIPTLAGGAAFGAGPRRAARLGFDAWVPTAAAATPVLERWVDQPPDPLTMIGPLPAELRPLPLRWTSITDQAIERLANRNPPVLHHRDRPIEAVRRDLSELLHLAHLSAVCEDPELLVGYVSWLEAVRPPRGLAPEALPVSLGVLADLTVPFGDRTSSLLRSLAPGA